MARLALVAEMPLLPFEDRFVLSVGGLICVGHLLRYYARLVYGALAPVFDWLLRIDVAALVAMPLAAVALVYCVLKA